jgi:predicted transcriptional regulator
VKRVKIISSENYMENLHKRDILQINATKVATHLKISNKVINYYNIRSVSSNIPAALT